MVRGTANSEEASAQTPSGASGHGSTPTSPTTPTSTSTGSLEDRMDRMEQRLEDVLTRLETAAGDPSAPSSAGAPPAPSGAGDPAPAPSPAASSATTDPADPTASDRFWALNALKSQLPAPGGVVYAGAVDLPIGHVEYQWGRPTDPLLRADWADRAERVAALGHPLRLSLLQKLLESECTVAQLVDELDLASTGVAYHHLHQLQAAGWVTSPARGTWSVPPTRVVPLLAIITALEEG
ncbi:helix-turn-helix domain-containing protein [Brachybacterium sp. ACRRE]|uniref:helix-turn-helix domain-containing protein n=1 Tax=Brachybacterium sp. ACRRE TaxID=2918184 RepID=UPI001EF2E431|nr:helix-turn-helix domain-containing protein [Brachybacterium sp. ACRRE]MCG7308939.1 helix-turn-helix domain-containing protein [Brachybacterium sp. ACRRE]